MSTVDTPEPAHAAPTHRRSVFGRLYYGETDVDFIGRWKLWFAVSGAILLFGLISLFARGLNLGIDFEGGVVWEVDVADSVSVSDAETAVDGIIEEPAVQELTSDDSKRIRVQAPDLSAEDEAAVTEAMAELGDVSVDDVSFQSVGPSWGKEITEKAQRALIVFLLVITLYITVRFEFRMAVATLAALVHDVLFTVGMYSIFQFPVTPATVIAILTILGFSIYDGIVVFDRVNDNTRLVSVQNRLTYSAMANRSLNEVLMRTVNTSVTALIPILSLLIIGSFFLGATTLQEFGLALFIGLASGAYSSIFIATPLLAVLKEREHRYRDIRARIEGRELADARPSRRAKAAPVSDEDDAEGTKPSKSSATRTSAAAGTVQPRARKVKKKRR